MEKTEESKRLAFNEKHDVVSWTLIIGAVIVFLATIFIFLKTLNSVVLGVGLLVSVVVWIIGYINLQKNIKNNVRISVINGGFYINKEINNYRQIGKDYDEKKEKYTHESWQTDIKKSLKQANDNYENELFRCLVRIYRDAKASSDVAKSVVLPVEMGIIAIVGDKTKDPFQAIVTAVVASFIMLVVSGLEVYDAEYKMSFAKDTVEAIYNKDKLNDFELLI